MTETATTPAIAPEKLLTPGTPMVLDLPAVAATLCVSATTVQLMVREGKFPEPRQLSDKRVGWLAIEVATWAASRPKSTQLPPPNTGARKPRAKQAATQAA